MSSRPQIDPLSDSSPEAPGPEQDVALARFQVLRPHIQDGVPLTNVAESTGNPIGTLRHWLSRFRAGGVAGLERKRRRDAGTHRGLDQRFVALIEGLALEVPQRSIASIHRVVGDTILREGAAPPSYATVRAVIKAIDPAMALLAREGGKAYADSYELLHRREADRPNAIWQADHTLLDIVVLDDSGAQVRPWLTVVIDDHSRAIATCRLFSEAPSALQTALALREAIWRKSDPAWPVCGIPAVLYTDHGSDFTSRHIERVCADLKIRLVFSLPGRPRGRGRVERFFSTSNQRVLSELPGYLGPGASGTKASISMATLDRAIRDFIAGEYHHTPHGGTGMAPVARWSAGGFLPQLPESLEQLDLLLLTVSRARQVHRDGVRLNGLRYIAPEFAAYVGEAVAVHFDPADMAELRIYHQDRFLCRTLLITPSVTSTPRSLREEIAGGRMLLRGIVCHATGDPSSGADPDSDARCRLIMVDEVDRLTTQSLEELRDQYDRDDIGLILIGMPGLEKRLARYPQLYSRIGFAHAFRPLSQEETLFVLQRHWQAWGSTWSEDEFTDREAHAAIIRVTGGNFRLIDRLMSQIARIKQLNHLTTVSKEVVEAARECLVIGAQ